MRYLFLIVTILSLHLFAKNIVWGDNFYVSLDKNRAVKTSEGMNVFGSFSLKDEETRAIRFTKDHLKYPKHKIILVRKAYTVYIVDLKQKKMIGQFYLPKRGTPRVITIKQNNKGFTDIISNFRILPKKGTKGHPGPLITQVVTYKNGRYSSKKKDAIKTQVCYNFKPEAKAKKSQKEMQEYFTKVYSAFKKTPLTQDKEHDASILEFLEQNQKDWKQYKYTQCHIQILLEVYPVRSRLFVESLYLCNTRANKQRIISLENMLLELETRQ